MESLGEMPLSSDEWQHAMQGAAGSLITSHKELLQWPLHDRQQEEQLTSPQAELQNKKIVKSKLLGIMRGASAGQLSLDAERCNKVQMGADLSTLLKRYTRSHRTWSRGVTPSRGSKWAPGCKLCQGCGVRSIGGCVETCRTAPMWK